MGGAGVTEAIVKGEGAAKVATPSGLSIRFESKPRRHYVIEGGFVYDDVGWGPDPDYPAIEAVSVTTALDVLYKGGLDWWGMRVGIHGVESLIRMGEYALTPEAKGHGFVGAVLDTGDVWQYVDRPKPGDAVENVEARLKEHGLRVDRIKDSAAERGANVHDALEAWSLTGNLPKPLDYPPSESGYVTGLVSFLTDSRIESVRQECLVGSYRHAFAGRFDLECFARTEQKVVTRCDLVKPKHAVLPLGLGRLDLKTSSGVYYNALLQLAGYELAAVESGYDASVWRGILRVTADGKYEVCLNPNDHRSITEDDFVQVLGTYRVAKKAEEAIKR